MADQFAHDTARDDLLILVDGLDRQIGTATKERAHFDGLLHRAFSVVLTRETAAGTEILLSRRAAGKYHSAGLWANSCCSHPRDGEQTIDAAYRRVTEELGLQAEGLTEVDAFVYRAEFETGLAEFETGLAEFETGLAEFEYDHVLLGTCSGTLAPDPTEVDMTRWVAAEDLATELAEHPDRFCAWAFMVLSITLAHL